VIRSTIILTVFISLSLRGQIKFSGTIIDKTTRRPVEYANIGLFEKGIGTVCNSFGLFDLVIPNDLLNSSIVIAHIGYENVTLKIAELISNPTGLKIELKPSLITLQEITVLASEQVSLGYRPNGNKVTGFFKAAGLGLEGATLVKNADIVVLTQFNLNIIKIPFDSLKFRLNIYSIKKGNPSAKINTKDVIFTITKADTGTYSLSLIDENIHVTNDFICAIELIELFGKSAEDAEFLFSAIPNKDGFIYKKAISFGSWERIKKHSLCFWFNGKMASM
jgi:hypothetical protein